ncbi:hypothetical protein BD626DRAFT_48157 [Schizophyllum amplum]|uniref:Uncharacterized protein n=1 Tax=Schizophyllum amplum TaxID=97359 RepID=A0A550BST9_9AGAR|nr:hypothetical protein BD626DRAFT_48157 [Auriculariopsis ampla]
MRNVRYNTLDIVLNGDRGTLIAPRPPGRPSPRRVPPHRAQHRRGLLRPLSPWQHRPPFRLRPSTRCHLPHLPVQAEAFPARFPSPKSMQTEVILPNIRAGIFEDVCDTLGEARRHWGARRAARSAAAHLLRCPRGGVYPICRSKRRRFRRGFQGQNRRKTRSFCQISAREFSRTSAMILWGRGGSWERGGWRAAPPRGVFVAFQVIRYRPPTPTLTDSYTHRLLHTPTPPFAGSRRPDSPIYRSKRRRFHPSFRGQKSAHFLEYSRGRFRGSARWSSGRIRRSRECMRRPRGVKRAVTDIHAMYRRPASGVCAFASAMHLLALPSSSPPLVVYVPTSSLPSSPLVLAFPVSSCVPRLVAYVASPTRISTPRHAFPPPDTRPPAA